MPKITIIDGNSLLFRAYYATAYPGVEIMRNKEGVPTNAIFAFSNMINKILSDLKEDESIIVAFDAGKQTFRKEQLDSYKANRKPAPEELVAQFPIARDFLRALNIFQFEEEGFEGDDIAGTVARLAEQEGYKVTIYTSDRDFLQLVDDKITVNIIRKGLSDVVPMTPELVNETYGFAPLQIIDYKGLRGDSSDNLPGIKGIGEKTAVKLIQEYGSFDNIIAHASEIKGKVGEAIIADQEMGRISRDLAIIKTDIPLSFTIKDTVYQGYEFNTISEFCQKYGLRQFMSKLVQKWKKVDLAQTTVNVKHVSTLNDIKDAKEIGLALDYEDDNYSLGLIYGLAVSYQKDVYYIDLEDLLKDKAALSLLKDKNVKKYCFDYKAIKVALAKNNVEINGLYFDILIASYLVDTSLNNNVEVVMNLYGIDITSSEESLSLFSNKDMEKTGKIAFFSFALYERISEDLRKISAIDLYNNLEIPLVDTLADMEIEGFPIDAKILDEFGDVYKKKTSELAEEIYALAGESFNIASPKQIGEILYVKLGLKGNKKMSTSVDSLKEIVDEHPIVSKILEYRKYFKLLTTYVEGIKNHIHDDGKIHAKFNQALTTTGRLSSSEPNLQNISVRDEEGKQIRKAFYYEDKNYEILSLDYSQIELRVLAALSNCQALKEIFLSNEDIHAATAKKIFNLQGEPTSLQRRRAKTVNFGIVYGISDWGLAEQLEIPPKEAREIINSFYSSFPEVGQFFQQIINDALKNGYVSTLLGRRRYLRELHDSNYQARESAKRAAMNAPVQGTASDLIKLAMNKVHQALIDNKLETKMILQIHDELIFKVPVNEKEKAYNLIKNIMENALSIDVPLLVDGGFGADWYSAKQEINMPELPEVETVKRVLLPIVKGRTIKRIDVLRKTIVNNQEDAFISYFENETFFDISRIGKFLIFHLSHNKVLISHLRMEGKYIELLENEDDTKYSRVVFHLDNNHKLCYDDSRSFGRMIMSDENSYLKEKEIAKLGPEPFNVNSVETILKQTKKMSLPIKTALLSQEIITGLGNIYVDEVLFASKIHPLTPAKMIKEKEWQTIIKESKRILNEAIEAGGSTIKSYHPGKDIDGNFQTSLKAYGKNGQKCVICHTNMRFIKVNGRGTTFCPRCQIKLGAPLKIAIVGKIASGKTTVLDVFRKHDYLALSSDEIVHDLYNDPKIRAVICKKLKFEENGDFINYLREHLKVKTNDLDRLEKTVHPLVKKEIERAFKESKSPLLVCEVPLLFKAKMENMFDVIIGIDIKEDIQVTRLSNRDKEKSAFLKHINDDNNYFDEHRDELDFVIYNNDNESKLIKEVESIINKVASRLN